MKNPACEAVRREAEEDWVGRGGSWGATDFHRRIFLKFRKCLQWARKHLRSGDLAVLFRISKRERADADSDQIERLMRRSFVKKQADDSLRPTAKGRLALWIKRLSGS